MTRRAGPRRWSRWAGLGLVAACLPLAACSGEEGEEAAEPYEPAQVEEDEAGGPSLIRFTEIGAAAVELETAVARQTGDLTVVDYAALIYDGTGQPWVYTVLSDLVFQRVEVVVDRIEDGKVLISSGLEPGTEVVTTGVTEVYGTELNIGGSS